MTAGGKLFNVIVDTESTGKQLLRNGDLRRRVTIIPLNKIQSHTVPPRVQQAAVRLVSYCFHLGLWFKDCKPVLYFLFFYSFYPRICRLARKMPNLHFLWLVTVTNWRYASLCWFIVLNPTTLCFLISAVTYMIRIYNILVFWSSSYKVFILCRSNCGPGNWKFYVVSSY